MNRNSKEEETIFDLKKEAKRIGFYIKKKRYMSFITISPFVFAIFMIVITLLAFLFILSPIFRLSVSPSICIFFCLGCCYFICICFICACVVVSFSLCICYICAYAQVVYFSTYIYYFSRYVQVVCFFICICYVYACI